MVILGTAGLQHTWSLRVEGAARALVHLGLIDGSLAIANTSRVASPFRSDLGRWIVLLSIAAVAGCGGSSNPAQGSGGSGIRSSSGGAVGTGGTVGSGGSGGVAGSSGAMGTGGTSSSSGGAVASGGASSAAGGTAATGGATRGSGGVFGTGGVATGSGGMGAGGLTGPVATGGTTKGTGGGGGGGGGVVMSTGGTNGGGGAATSSGGASGTGGQSSGFCKAGTQYPAPDLTGTPKLLSKPSGSSSGTYEGPVWLAGNGVLLFSDMTFTSPVDPSQMLKLTPPTTVATYLQDAGTNGMAIDSSGVVFACSHKVQGIVKLDYAAGTFTTVIDNVGGKKFNSPNDLALRSDGTIYFTDPDFQLGSRTSETGKKGIYRVNPSGQVSLIDDTFGEPNGISFSPSESVLYVADNQTNVVRTFAVAADGSTSNRKDFVTVQAPDGFAVDCAGNLYVASGTPGAIQVYSPSGTKLGSVTVAASLSNLAFGGSDGKTLYITAGKALYSLDMNLPGYPY